jgi:hypothetical protein
MSEAKKRTVRPRIEAVSTVLKAALVGQKIVRLLEPMSFTERQLAVQVVNDHFAQTVFASVGGARKTDTQRIAGKTSASESEFAGTESA